MRTSAISSSKGNCCIALVIVLLAAQKWSVLTVFESTHSHIQCTHTHLTNSIKSSILVSVCVCVCVCVCVHGGK